MNNLWKKLCRNLWKQCGKVCILFNIFNLSWKNTSFSHVLHVFCTKIYTEKIVDFSLSMKGFCTIST